MLHKQYTTILIIYFYNNLLLLNAFLKFIRRINSYSAGVNMTEIFDLYIIDDDPIVIASILDMLSEYSIKIKTFTDPIQGLKELTETPPRVLFLDYNMPEMNGKDVVVKMSERYLFQYTAVYLISGIALNAELKVQLQTLGFSQIIQKPFTKDDLCNALTNEDIIGNKQSAA
jgi:CheY-like chemotaxis protein